MDHLKMPKPGCKKLESTGKNLKINPRSDDVMDMDKGRNMEIGKVREGQTPAVLKKR